MDSGCYLKLRFLQNGRRQEFVRGYFVACKLAFTVIVKVRCRAGRPDVIVSL
jgi:hypothetical protein